MHPTTDSNSYIYPSDYTTTAWTDYDVTDREVVETVEEWVEVRDGIEVTIRKKTTKTTSKPRKRSPNELSYSSSSGYQASGSLSKTPHYTI